MEIKTVQSCWASNNDSSLESNKLKCPKCETEGKAVSLETVSNLVIEERRSNLLGNEYHICIQSDCEVAYYSSDYETIIEVDDVITPIWYKQNAKPKYACYCNKVTIDEVVDAIHEHNCKTIKDLMKYTEVMINGKCKTTHPYGECCSTQLNKLLKENC